VANDVSMRKRYPFRQQFEVFADFLLLLYTIAGANRLKIQINFLTVIDSVETKCCARKGRIKGFAIAFGWYLCQCIEH
jgi:hypothetical protein